MRWLHASAIISSVWTVPELRRKAGLCCAVTPACFPSGFRICAIGSCHRAWFNFIRLDNTKSHLKRARGCAVHV